MTDPEADSGHYSVDRYFEMAECGSIAADDRVELLEGLIVSMATCAAARSR